MNLTHDSGRLLPKSLKKILLVFSILLVASATLVWGPMTRTRAQTVTVTPAAAPTPTDNDYTRIRNAIQAATPGSTINLSGTFNWTEPNAAASWALGNDGIGGTIDDYSILVPAGLNNVTVTAASLGAATIQGPGDLAAYDLEGVFFFNGGPNQNWVISNLRLLDFDLGIGMFQGAGGGTAFNGTTITNNYIRVPTDLNPVVAPNDVFQNIAIHFSWGANQTISNNTIDIGGDGVSAAGAGNESASTAIQSNTFNSNNNVYNGLLIDNNRVRILRAQSATPEVILGIWENGYSHQGNQTIRNNQFLNFAGGNVPANNRQRGFRITSHSTAASTTLYQGNTVIGANIGFEWIEPGFIEDFSAFMPVQLLSDTVLDCNTGIVVQSLGRATIANLTAGNSIFSATSTGVRVDTGSIATIQGTLVSGSNCGNFMGRFNVAVDVNGGNATVRNTTFIRNVTGVLVRNAGTANLGDGVTPGNNCFVQNTSFAVNNTTGAAINALQNWWNAANGPGAPGGTGGGDPVSTNVNFTPFLTTGCPAGSTSCGNTGFAENGVLLVADTQNNRVQKFDGLNWTVVGADNKPGSGPGQFTKPEAVTGNFNASLIFVADANRVQRSTDGGNTWIDVAVTGGLPQNVNAPQGLALDLLGNLYVGDTGQNRVKRFEGGAPGVPVVLAQLGAGAGLVNNPRGLAIDNNFNLFVADTGNSRVQRFNNVLSVLTTPVTPLPAVIVADNVSSTTRVRNPEGVATTNTGNLYVADTQNNRILLFPGGNPGVATIIATGPGTAINQVSTPEGVAVNQFVLGTLPVPSLQISDTAKHRILSVPIPPGTFVRIGGNITNTSGSIIGQFNLPSKIK